MRQRLYQLAVTVFLTLLLMKLFPRYPYSFVTLVVPVLMSLGFYDKKPPS